MSPRTSSLTQGGYCQNPRMASRRFITTTPPRIAKSTHVVAATHPCIATAAHNVDGWFLADFLAMNYLLTGLGASQTWFSLATPQDFFNKHGEYTHGNPYEDSKIILSQEMIESSKFTPVTVVRASNIIENFLKKVAQVTEKAKREGGSVLLLLFCHGIDQEHLALDYTGKEKLSITMLKGVLEPDVPVCLLTTACYSGGWSVCPEINISTMTAADEQKPSTSWPQSSDIRKTFPGSVFVNSVITALTSTTSELLDAPSSDNPVAHEPLSMQPDPATPDQIATYNAFCRSIWDSCRGLYRLWNEHAFTFSAQDDEWDEPWTKMAALSLAEYKAKWDALQTRSYEGPASTLNPSSHNTEFQDGNNLSVRRGSAEDDMFIGPLMQSLYHNRLAEMIKLWMQTCPGDEVRGYGPMLTGLMQKCAESGYPIDIDNDDDEDPYARFNIVAIIQYRLNLALLAEDLLAIVGLQRPGDQSCLMWNSWEWEESMMRKLGTSLKEIRDQTASVWDILIKANVVSMIGPAAEQGPRFPRFQRYLIAAVVEAQKPELERDQIVAALITYIDKAAQFYKAIAIKNPEVRRRGKEWLDTLTVGMSQIQPPPPM